MTIPTRIPELPDVPTLAEAGVPDVIGGTWLALMAPAGTPMPIVKKLEGACRQIGASDDFKARMKSLSGTPIGSSADELTAQMQDGVAAVGGGGQIGKYQVRPIIGNRRSNSLMVGPTEPWPGAPMGALPAGPVPRRNPITE